MMTGAVLGQGLEAEQLQLQLDPAQHALGEMIERMKLDRMRPRPASIRVNIGIDEDLKMILDMDPSIMDMVPPPQTPRGVVTPHAVPVPTSLRVTGLPPRGPPSFKQTSTPLRTQVKQQLMREQHLEQERREQQRKLQQQQQKQQQIQQHQQQQLQQQQQQREEEMKQQQEYFQTLNEESQNYLHHLQCLQQHQQQQQTQPPPQEPQLHLQPPPPPPPQQQQHQQQPIPPRLPMNIGVDVPQSVFQVRTVLENPTKYHVLEKSKSQVKQYLRENLQQHPQTGDPSTSVPPFDPALSSQPSGPTQGSLPGSHTGSHNGSHLVSHHGCQSTTNSPNQHHNPPVQLRSHSPIPGNSLGSPPDTICTASTVSSSLATSASECRSKKKYRSKEEETDRSSKTTPLVGNRLEENIISPTGCGFRSRPS